MKKMQCEVCGSTEIKKIDDSTFECQSCGVQYSKNELQKLLVEITGNVKVDHSQEVENTIKRAEQFENDGDSQKAKEYYNKALDMDAENEKAQQRIKEIEDNQEIEEYYIVDSAVDPKENVKQFLKQLATAKSMACDIYKHIKIDSVIEKYVTAMFVSIKNEYEWSAIACNRYYENQTVYKEKYDSQLKKYVKEPVTEKVEKISRTPINGTNTFENDGFALASNSVQQEFLTNNELIEEMVRDFEQLQREKHNVNKYISLDSSKIARDDNSNYKYNNIAVDMDFDHSIYIKKLENILNNCDGEAEIAIRNSMRADFVENYQWHRRMISKNIYKILIPVQVINFSYKGEKYVAVSDLISNTTSMPMIYPCDSELAEKKETLIQDNAETKKMPPIMKCGIWFEVACFILLFIGGFLELDALIIVGLSFMVISVILLIIGAIQKVIKKKKFEENSQKYKLELFNPRKVYLSESYNIFFNSYSSAFNLDEIQQNIPENVINIAFHARIACFDEINEFSTVTNDTAKKEEIIIAEKQEELLKIKKKKILPIILMVVGFLLLILGCIFSATDIVALVLIFIFSGLALLAVVGPIILIKINKKIATCNQELQQLRDYWLED